MKIEQNILFSIIVPVYNISAYVRKCIESIVNQTYQNLDIILVDDGSTDDSGVICDEYAEKDSRIRVIHKTNGGLVSARKAGINIAKGEYSLYVDGDDWIENDYIELVSTHIYNQPDAIISMGHTREYPGNHSIKYSDGLDIEHRLYSGSELNEIIIENYISIDKFYSSAIPFTICSYVCKTEILNLCQNEINDSITIAEDMACAFKIILNCKSVYLLDSYKYHYVQHKNSMVKKDDDKYLEKRKCLFRNLEDSVNNYSGTYSKDRLRKKILFTVFDSFLIKSFYILQKPSIDYIFPYPEIKKNSRIFVYGIGTYGQEIIKSLNNSDKGIEIAGLSDGRWEDYKNSGIFINNPKYEVISPERIKDIKFDYLIIAVTKYNMRISIKKNLLEKGIAQSKIADINTDLFTRENLDYIFNC